MNKHIRSRILAASIVSTTLLGTGGIFYTGRLFAQDRPPATELLDRGARLYDQKQYGEAKKILTDIDPAQLPEDQRARLRDLVTRSDVALQQSMGPSQRLDDAQADMDHDQLASAVSKFQAIAGDASLPQDVRNKAQIQLQLAQQKQLAQVPRMKQLLADAQKAYDAGNLNDAEDALKTIVAIGAPLNWEDTPRVNQLRGDIANKRLAMARPANGGPGTGGQVAVGPGGPNPMDVGAGGPGANQGPGPGAGPLDQMPGTMPGMGQGPAPAPAGGLLGDVLGSDAVRRDRALTLYNEAMRHSDEALAARPRPNYVVAANEAQGAIDIIDQSRTSFSEIEANAMREAARRQLLNVQNLSAATTETERLQGQNQAAIDEARRTKTVAAARHAQVVALVTDAYKLERVSQFEQSADLLRQAVLIDPQDENARFALRMVENRINDRKYEELVHREGVETMRQNVDNLEHLIPYADLMVYPDNWQEITRKRTGNQSSQESNANRIARERLDENLKEVTVEAKGLEKVIDFLQANTNSNIIVNWKALEAAQVTRNTEVTVSLHEVPFKKALEIILAQVGGTTADLGYMIDGGIITISTKEDLRSARYVGAPVVYDIRDLLVTPANRQAPQLNLNQQSNSVTTGSGSGGGGFGGGGNQGGGFGGQGGGQQGGQGQGGIFGQQQNGQNTQNLQQTREQAVTALITSVKTLVAPDSWHDVSGGPGSITELNGQLIVTQTVENQQLVLNLLQQLRETRAVQIAIEARLLLVSNNFLDDFRIGWNLSLPAGTIGSNVGAFGIGNLNTYTQSAPATTGVLGAIAQNPSLNLSASIIDNWTLNLLLTATQADKRTVTVTAPRITIFNGQSGFIAVTNQQNYVSNFNQTTSAGGIAGGAATATSLTISQLNVGVTLQVEATVSSDRRYVVMNVDPVLSTLDGLDLFSTGGTTPTTTGGSSGSLTATGGAFVQLPRIANTEVSTMVSIPDGGTLLIGGQKIIGEQEIEIGVPVLSKIPGLNRLFTNRSFTKDERTLLVLVRPNIIIHSEIERDLFGTGYDRPTGYPGNNGGGTTPAAAPGGL